MSDVVNEQEIDKLINETKEDLLNKPEIEKNTTKPTINNAGHKQQTTTLPGVGDVDLVDQNEVDDTLEKFQGVLFKVQNCVFRVCYIDKRKGRFSAEIANLR